MRINKVNDVGNFDSGVRLHVYRHFIETGGPPTAAETAAAVGCTTKEAQRSYRRLHERHVLVLAPGTCEIRMAMPFSGVPTPFRVTVDERSWWAN